MVGTNSNANFLIESFQLFRIVDTPPSRLLPMFTRRTLGALGGRLYPWRRGHPPRFGIGETRTLPGTPSRSYEATRLWPRPRFRELCIHTEASITDFILLDNRQAPFTMAPLVARQPRRNAPRAVKTTRLLQVTGPIPGDVRGPLLHPARSRWG